MANTFFIGDTHFGHKNIISFESIEPFRPFTTIKEHDEELVRRWNLAMFAVPALMIGNFLGKLIVKINDKYLQ